MHKKGHTCLTGTCSFSVRGLTAIDRITAAFTRFGFVIEAIKQR
jgi:hypothetical protein